MSTKLKLLGLPEGATLYMQRPRLTARYRADLNSQEAFEKYLDERRAHLIDPFEFSGVDPIQ
jgi:hypothetical protein